MPVTKTTKLPDMTIKLFADDSVYLSLECGQTSTTAAHLVQAVTQPAPVTVPPLTGTEWLTGPDPDGGLYEVWCTYTSDDGFTYEPKRSGNVSTCDTYTKAEAERRAANEQRAMGSLWYCYFVRPAAR